MGNGTQSSLNKIGLRVRDISGLFITHHHLDHNEELVPIFINVLLGRGVAEILGPPGTKEMITSNLNLYEEDISYRLGRTKRNLNERIKSISVKDMMGGESFYLDKIKVSTLKVPHTIHTLAYRFDYNGSSVVITGDLTLSKELSGFSKDSDFMIIDSGGMIMKNSRQRKRKNTNGRSRKSKRVRAHLDLNDSSLMANEANIKNLVYTHFTLGEIDKESSLIEIRKNYNGNVIFGADLMVLSKPKEKVRPYSIVDTGQIRFYGDSSEIQRTEAGTPFYGQDASFIINHPSYTNNNDGTIKDNISGLIWQQSMGDKMTLSEAREKAKELKFGGFQDWRIPTIKELYSLIQFTGQVKGQRAITPFIDTSYFKQPIGDSNRGEREIDAQTWSSTEYVGRTMRNDETIFGVNFVDGRIKGYPKYNPRSRKLNRMYFRLVRGNKLYGKNQFIKKSDTVVDKSTGLIWQKSDSLKGMNWKDALKYADELILDGHSDWRLPNAKELQSILDYTRSPETSNTPAINPIFKTTAILNEGGERDYPYFWSSTTHLDGPIPEKNAVYFSFGRAMGKMRGKMMDVHGAGSQRSDPKVGTPKSRGPQGDMIRVQNYVRCVRGGNLATNLKLQSNESNTYSKSKLKQKKSNHSYSKLLRRLDKNGDGKISMSEFRGPDKAFKRRDKNNDGYLSEDEAPTGPPRKKR